MLNSAQVYIDLRPRDSLNPSPERLMNLLAKAVIPIISITAVNQSPNKLVSKMYWRITTASRHVSYDSTHRYYHSYRKSNVGYFCATLGSSLNERMAFLFVKEDLADVG